MSPKRSVSIAVGALLLASLLMAGMAVQLWTPPTQPKPGLNAVAVLTEPPSVVPVVRAQPSAEKADWPKQPERKFVDLPNPKLVARSITAEPTYQHEPRYCLLTFGLKAETRVWLIEAGDVLYVDRNANGIVGEPGESVPIGPSPLVDSKEYKVGSIGGDEKNPLMFEVSITRYLSEGERNYVIEGKLSESISQYAGWGGRSSARIASPRRSSVLEPRSPRCHCGPSRSCGAKPNAS